MLTLLYLDTLINLKSILWFSKQVITLGNVFEYFNTLFWASQYRTTFTSCTSYKETILSPIGIRCKLQHLENNLPGQPKHKPSIFFDMVQSQTLPKCSIAANCVQKQDSSPSLPNSTYLLLVWRLLQRLPLDDRGTPQRISRIAPKFEFTPYVGSPVRRYGCWIPNFLYLLFWREVKDSFAFFILFFGGKEQL